MYGKPVIKVGLTGPSHILNSYGPLCRYRKFRFPLMIDMICDDDMLVQGKQGV